MLERLLLPDNDLGDLLAIPFHLFPKGTGRAALLAILVGGIFALAVERRRCSQVVAVTDREAPASGLAAKVPTGHAAHSRDSDQITTRDRDQDHARDREAHNAHE